MRFSENRKVAFAVLAVCVLVSVFGFSSMGLARERGKVLTVYDRGADTTLSVRSSMDAYLDAAAEEAQLMASEAELHLGAGQGETVSALAQQLATQTDLDARYEAYGSLKTASDKLYDTMYRELSSDADLKNFKIAYDNFWGYDDLIKHDEYHKLAASYNNLISSFPGGVVAKLTGQGALNTFGG